MNVPQPLAWATVATSAVLWVSGGVYVSLEQIDRWNQQKETQAAVGLVCDRAKILLDVIRGGIAIVTAERMDPGVPKATHIADDVFIALFESDQAELKRQQNAPGSPCVKLKKELS